MKRIAIIALTAITLVAGMTGTANAQSKTCATPTAHNTALYVWGGSCRIAKQLARATSEQYYLDRDGYIDPYTRGPRIWPSCRMNEYREGRSMVVTVDCRSRGTSVSMVWVWRGVWL